MKNMVRHRNKNIKNNLLQLKRFSQQINKNEDGILIIDFIFAFMLLLGFSIMLFSISMTLTVTEVLQYMTFSSARVYAVADTNIQESEVNAINKFKELYAHPVVQPLFRNRWFVIEGNEPVVGDFTQLYAEKEDRSTFHGVMLPFEAKILDKNIPLIGSTNGGVEGGAFKTQVQSFLGREPSQKDCDDFNDKRWEWLQQLDGYQSPYLQQNINGYVRSADNGC